MSMPELFTALQQGTVDGQENPLSVILAAKLYEVQDQLSMLGYVFGPVAVVASPVLYETLSDEEKGWFHEAAQAAAKANRAEVSRLEEEGVAALRQHGMTVTTDIDPAPFKAAVTSVYDSFVERYGDDLLTRIRDSGC